MLILTTFHDDDAVHEAFRAGASGFLLKTMAPRWLAESIRAVASGDAWLHPSVTRRLWSDFTARPRPSARVFQPVLDRLTAREREILSLVAHGMSNAQIAGHLTISEATVGPTWAA